jgi:hypothetical protein
MTTTTITSATVKTQSHEAMTAASDGFWPSIN